MPPRAIEPTRGARPRSATGMIAEAARASRAQVPSAKNPVGDNEKATPVQVPMPPRAIEPTRGARPRSATGMIAEAARASRAQVPSAKNPVGDNEKATTVVADDSEETLKRVGGSQSDDWNHILGNQAESHGRARPCARRRAGGGSGWSSCRRFARTGALRAKSGPADREYRNLWTSPTLVTYENDGPRWRRPQGGQAHPWHRRRPHRR